MAGSSSLIKLIGMRRLSKSDGFTNQAEVDEESIGPATPSSPCSTWISFEQTGADEKEHVKSSGDGSASWSVERPRKVQEERERSGPSNTTGLMKEDAMDQVCLDSFYVPPISRKYAHQEKGVQEKYEQRLHETGRFRVFWRNIVYRINTFSLMKHVMNIAMKTVPETYERTIFSLISGSFESGKLIALMGPSGAGKTTLLECLIGQRVSGLSGGINIQSINKHPLPPLQMTLIPQLDSFFEKLKPREAIRYASKMKKPPLLVNHDHVSQGLIDRLGLTSSCGLEKSRLSSSQRERPSIACDLLFKPNVLVLDEPTNGLDAWSVR